MTRLLLAIVLLLTSPSDTPGAASREAGVDYSLAGTDSLRLRGTPHSDAGPAETAGVPYLPSAALDVRQGREGWIAYAEFGSYVAIPLGPGVAITVCGPGGCIDTVSTDAGPNRKMLRAGRIMDLDRAKWRAVCGMSTERGLCWGSWVLAVPEARPKVTLPPTDTTPIEAEGDAP